MVQVVPNITTASLKEAKEKLTKLLGVVDKVHIDIADGKLTNTKTFTLNQLRNIHLPKNVSVLVHLMVSDPLKFIDDAKKIGTKIVIGQIEMMPNQGEFVKKVKAEKMKVGLALDDGTSVEEIDKDLLFDLEIVLIMTIKAGWIGREFKKERLEEVRKLKKLKENNRFKYKIAVDGGVNKKTISDCVKAGAEVLFMHSAVWKNKNIKEAIKDLKNMANEN